VKLIDENQLNELFYQSILNNTSQNITGILLYKEGTFIQILEGKDRAINNLFKTIHDDKDHNNITKIIDRRIEKRLFENFRAGYITLNNYKKMDILETFLRNRNNPPHSNVILAVLSPFLNKRSILELDQ
jgi:hypothetical protein